MDTKDLIAVVNDRNGWPMGVRTQGAVPRFLGLPLALDQQGAPIPHTGTTVATLRRQIIVPGGLLGPNGRVRWELDAQLTNSANLKQIDLRLNGTSMYNISRTATQWERLELELCNTGVEGSQQTTLRTANGVATVNTYNVNSQADMALEMWVTLANAGETVTLHKSLMLVYASE